MVITSLRRQAGFFSGNPLALPTHATLDNYRLVLNNGFVHYFANSVIVTVATVAVAVTVSFMAAFAIVRGTSARALSGLLGLPARPGDPAPGHDRADLLHDHQDPSVRHPVRADPPVHRLCHPFDASSSW